MFCQKCGTQNSDDDRFCSKCGNDLKFPKVETERKGITGKLGKMGVPGFRSGKTWKMGLAFIGYFFIFLILLAALSPSPAHNSNSKISTTPIPTTKIVPETATHTTAPTPTSQKNEIGSYENPANVGTMIADRTAEFTVLEVNKVSRQSILTTNQYRDDAPEGYRFDLLKIQIKNIGDREINVMQYEPVKIFANGVEVQQTIMDSPKQFPALKGGTIMPGATMTGWLVAIVPEDTGYLVQYKSNMFNSVGGWVQVT